MISLAVLFYIFIFIFALIGAIRGWAKEVIATFSVFLGLFVITVFFINSLKFTIANIIVTYVIDIYCSNLKP